MKRAEAVEKIHALMPELRELGVSSISLFGSVVHDRATAHSDIDLIAEFDPPHTFRQYVDTLLLLEDRLGVRVDLAEPHTLHPAIRHVVTSEAVTVSKHESMDGPCLT